MSLTPAIDPVAAPLLGEHTKDVLRKTLGYDDRRIAALAEAGAFGKVGQYGLRARSAAKPAVRKPIAAQSTGTARAATKFPWVSCGKPVE